MKPQTLQYDPDVKIPAAVRAAAARSDELYRTMQDNPQPAPEDQPQEQQVTSEGNPELSAESLAAPTAQPAPAPAPAPAPESQLADDDSWEHKYKSIHGRYLRSQEQIREMSERLSNMQAMLATMQQAPAQPTDLPELAAEKLITDEEVNDYGKDFLDVVGKKAKEEIAPVIKAYQQKITELEQKIQGFQGHVQQTSSEKLLAKLDEKLPDWRKLNTNEEFLSWLRLPDPYSGAIRHDMLKAAYAQGDAHRVLAFFNGFLAEEAVVAPAEAEPDVSVTKVPKVPLKDLAAPGRAKTAASASAPAEKPFITRAQIAAFYADVNAGKYRGRDAEKLKAETMIFDAQREGRIR